MQNSNKFSSTRTLLICTAVSALMSIAGLSTSANAADYKYYKSTGANGEVFLTQFSPRGVKAELISKRSDGRAEDAGEMNGKTNAKPVKKKTKQDLRVEALEAKDKKRAEQDKIARCQKLRENLTQLNIGGKVYETSKDGERNFMTDQQIADKRAEYQGGIDEHCSGE